jgi:ankyrin repeat protein
MSTSNVSTPLISAIVAGNIVQVRTLIHGEDISVCDNNGLSPLMHAVMVNDADIVHLLVDKGAKTYYDDNINIVVCTAIKKNSPDIANFLLIRGANANETNVDGFTPLHLAARKQFADVVMTLLDKNADVNKPNLVSGGTPLHYVLDAHITAMLIARGAKLDARSEDGTPLIRACRDGLPDVVSTLIKAGADMNVAQANGQTPLLLAIMRSDEEEEEGAGSMALTLATMLLDEGADVNFFGNGETPLTCAITRRKGDLVELLVARGADLNLVDHNDVTPLKAARLISDRQRATWLVEKGADSSKEILGRHKAPKMIKGTIGRLALIFRLCVTYLDVITDYFTLSVYYKRAQYGLFALALMFVAIPTVLSVSMRRGWWGRFLSLTQLSLLDETIKAWNDGQETQLLTTLTALESVLEACPSALLQFFALWDVWFETSDRIHNSFVSSTTDLALLGSVALSVLATSRFLSDFLTTKSEREVVWEAGLVVMQTPLLFVLYHVCEESFRLFTLVALFLALREFGLLILIIGFLSRFWLITVWFEGVETFKTTKVDIDSDPNWLNHNLKVAYRLILSLATDCLWTKSNAAMQLLTLFEGGVYLIMLYLVMPDKRNFQIPVLAYSILAAGVCKTFLYYLTYWNIYENRDYFISQRESLGSRATFSYVPKDVEDVADIEFVIVDGDEIIVPPVVPNTTENIHSQSELLDSKLQEVLAVHADFEDVSSNI